MDEAILEILKRYNQSLEFDCFFRGLPFNHRVIIRSLVSDANSVSGRANENLYTKQKVRSYLRTIDKFCPDYFQVISESQKLIIKFQTLPSTYAEHFKGNNQRIIARVDGAV